MVCPIAHFLHLWQLNEKKVEKKVEKNWTCSACLLLQQVEKVTKLDAEGACPFVGESLRILRQEVGNEAAVLGFVGAPFTLATYIIEGGSSKSFAHTKRMAFGNPEVLHALLDKLADNVADYVRYQVRGLCQVQKWFRL